MEASYTIIQKDNEYRILLTPVNTEVLPEYIQKVLADRQIDISELMIERIHGETRCRESLIHLYNLTTTKMVLDIVCSSIL